MGVKPWERDVLAKPEMQLDSRPVDAALDDHIYFSKPKHAADRGRDAPELGDGTKPKPPERGPSLGR